nr:capsid protein precursor [Bactrian camel astrovirus]
MANRQQKRIPRTTTNIVVRNGSGATQARASGPAASNKRRRNRARKNPPVNVRVFTNKNKVRRKNPRLQGFGNRVVVQKIVTTLGTVGSNGSGQIETELAVLLNPSTMKESTGSNSYGPVQIYASTYSLFSIRSLRLHLKPLVGSSAVSGTVIRTSWNPTNNPTQMSWSALGARKHTDTTPGRDGRFSLSARDLAGPKDGWYRTNTKGEPMLSFAGSLEIHTFGETRSTYQNGQFTGGLFLAELEIVWAFKDYSQQPGLMNLLKGDSEGAATVSTDAAGKLILTTPSTSTLARAATSNTASEIIWMVTDAVIQGVASSFPQPFGWLIRGGWWFLKRIAGSPLRNGEEQFEIYASINDARAGVPCVSDTPNHQGVNIGQLHFQQITPGNTGIGNGIPASRAIDYAPAIPTQCFVSATTRLKEGVSDDYVPAYTSWYAFGNSQNYINGVGFLADNTRVATFNVYKVTASTNVGIIDHTQFANTIPIYLFYNDNQKRTVGFAVAARYDYMDQPTSVRVSSLLVYATNSEAYSFQQNWKAIKVEYPVSANNNSYSARIATPTTISSTHIRVKFDAGNWYILQFVTHGIINLEYKVGDVTIACRGTGGLPTTVTEFVPSTGDANTGLIPAYMSGLHLDVLTSSDVQSDSDGRRLDLEPSFGCDDSCEEQYFTHEEDEEEEPDFEDENLELGLGDHYSDPPMSRLVVREDAQEIFQQLRASFSEREARLAVNQLKPSDEYSNFTILYHDALTDGLSPRDARAFALGL